MITFKIYKFEKFEENHREYFNQLLDFARINNFLSSTIEEIIITDDILGEIERYTVDRLCESKLTQNREYLAIAKTIQFGEKVKIFFNATSVNGYVKSTPQVFFEQLIGVHANDLISLKYKEPSHFYSSTPLTEVIKIFFSQWAKNVLTATLEKVNSLPKEVIRGDVKIYVDAFKRNIRKFHFQYQSDSLIDVFWIDVIKEVDGFIHRCLDVQKDSGNFSHLQEFSEIIPSLLLEIESQTINLMDDKKIDFQLIRQLIIALLNKCLIDIPSENPMRVKIIDTPKNLFKDNIVDTEQRIVVFIDILGFSDIIKEYDSNEHSNILNELHDALENAIKVSIEDIVDAKFKTDLKEYLDYRMFSDCICLSVPYIESGSDFHIQFYLLSTIAITYQFEMIKKGFFVRGGVSIGSFFANKNMIFSGGLVNAYKLEQKACYPILVVDEKILNRLKIGFSKNTKGLFYEKRLLYANDNPKRVFLNPFYFLENSTIYIDQIS
ncbi:MAG TPA: hypothetical protein VLB84_00790 [Bacteroidia bacterium]|nr:hypothetical protein [Bacteroidia bacterium]